MNFAAARLPARRWRGDENRGEEHQRLREADATYYQRRADEEKNAYVRATHPAAARAHRTLAEKYLVLAEIAQEATAA